ncbi:MAG: hypothetical protein WAS27_01625 [Candidatus Saccharimonadales bacterium]
MAKNVDKNALKIVGVKASTIALFEGVLAGAIGLVIAVVYSLRATVSLTQETNSLLAGLTLGTAAGIISIIVVPLVYFAIGWIVGYLHAFVFNSVVRGTEGIVVYTDK